MFQTFDVSGGPEFGQKHLPKLREQLILDGLDGFLIPHEDEYNNEYLPACNERLLWASGFSGSAGFAVVLSDHAALFADGRYTLQAAQQVDNTLFSLEKFSSKAITTYLATHVKAGMRIGYDPKLHTPKALNPLKIAIEQAGGILCASTPNPLDRAWTDRPAPPMTKLSVQAIGFAGEPHDSKRARIGAVIDDKESDFALITAPASIAWLLNIRGSDVRCSPLPLCTLLLSKDGSANLFIAPEKLTDGVRQHLGQSVRIYEEASLPNILNTLEKGKVLVDPSQTTIAYFETLNNAGYQIIEADDPIALPKACKNNVEIAGAKAAHIRDGAAVTRFLHWLDTTAQSGEIDEIECVKVLEGFRHQTGALKDISFDSISGAGANGAIVHYRVSTDSTAILSRGSLFLIDSGGQYLDGTTDITRTVPIGQPSKEMRTCFTLVLKGHIALSSVRFPAGTTGSALDALARAPLWEHGLDYDHGTGHGVGAYLGVHEGPHRISKLPNSIALQPGMILSNEPGYYKTDAFGIRIENLQFVTPPTQTDGQRHMLGFETLTLAPIHKGLIVKSMLTRDERHWLNAYHDKVIDKISPLIPENARLWLKTACAPL